MSSLHTHTIPKQYPSSSFQMITFEFRIFKNQKPYKFILFLQVKAIGLSQADNINFIDSSPWHSPRQRTNWTVAWSCNLCALVLYGSTQYKWNNLIYHIFILFMRAHDTTCSSPPSTCTNSFQWIWWLSMDQNCCQ